MAAVIGVGFFRPGSRVSQRVDRRPFVGQITSGVVGVFGGDSLVRVDGGGLGQQSSQAVVGVGCGRTGIVGGLHQAVKGVVGVGDYLTSSVGVLDDLVVIIILVFLEKATDVR